MVKAIEWLSGQPSTVRESAKSADLIVSHYLQARRQNITSPVEQTLCHETFKSDLKSLAEELRGNDNSPVIAASQRPASASPPLAMPSPAPLASSAPARAEALALHRPPSYVFANESSLPEFKETQMAHSHSRMEPLFRAAEANRAETATVPLAPQPQVHAPAHAPSPGPAPLMTAPPSMGHAVRPQVEATLHGLSWNVDARSLAIARELKERLNLSCEGEALRMLVSLGTERFKGFLPQI